MIKIIINFLLHFSDFFNIVSIQSEIFYFSATSKWGAKTTAL